MIADAERQSGRRKWERWWKRHFRSDGSSLHPHLLVGGRRELPRPRHPGKEQEDADGHKRIPPQFGMLHS